jgi:hypothetical protein
MHTLIPAVALRSFTLSLALEYHISLLFSGSLCALTVVWYGRMSVPPHWTDNPWSTCASVTLPACFLCFTFKTIWLIDNI